MNEDRLADLAAPVVSAVLKGIEAGADHILASAGEDGAFFAEVAADLARALVKHKASTNLKELQEYDRQITHLKAQVIARSAEIEIRVSNEAKEQLKSVVGAVLASVIRLSASCNRLHTS